MRVAKPPETRWAAHLAELCREVGASRDPGAEPPRLAIWQILHFTLSRYARYHAARLGVTDPADLEDVVSQKALEIVQGIDMSKGRLLELRDTEIPGFLSTIVRNGLVDLLRSKHRRTRATGEDARAALDETVALEAPDERPDTRLEGREFARALSGCAKALDARARLVWFFRVFYELPTKEIAAHPCVRLKAGHVDVLLQRARKAIRACMEARGLTPGDMPPGTFVEMWRTFRPLVKEGRMEAV